MTCFRESTHEGTYPTENVGGAMDSRSDNTQGEGEIDEKLYEEVGYFETLVKLFKFLGRSDDEYKVKQIFI